MDRRLPIGDVVTNHCIKRRTMRPRRDLHLPGEDQRDCLGGTIGSI